MGLFFSDCAAPFVRLAFAALLFAVALSYGAACGKANDGSYSEVEKVGFALFKLGEVEPDFEDWVKQTDDYKITPSGEQDNFLRADTVRLQRGLSGYNPDQDLIRVILSVALTPEKKQKAGNPAAGGSFLVKLESGGGLDDIYLPFVVGGIPVAVIPQDLENLARLSLNEDEYKGLFEVLHYKGANSTSLYADLELHLRPIAVDLKNPAFLQGNQFLPMLVEVGSAVIRTKDDTKIAWSWEAPWFATKRTSTLMNLYSK